MKPLILVADDDAKIRRLLVATLSTRFEVLEAADGAQALELIRRHRPVGVVLDVMMPGDLDGLQVLMSLRADPLLQGMLVLIVSGRSDESDIETGMLYGADAYFAKPFSPTQLVHWFESRIDLA